MRQAPLSKYKRDILGFVGSMVCGLMLIAALFFVLLLLVIYTGGVGLP